MNPFEWTKEKNQSIYVKIVMKKKTRKSNFKILKSVFTDKNITSYVITIIQLSS